MISRDKTPAMEVRYRVIRFPDRLGLTECQFIWIDAVDLTTDVFGGCMSGVFIRQSALPGPPLY